MRFVEIQTISYSLFVSVYDKEEEAAAAASLQEFAQRDTTLFRFEQFDLIFFLFHL